MEKNGRNTDGTVKKSAATPGGKRGAKTGRQKGLVAALLVLALVIAAAVAGLFLYLRGERYDDEDFYDPMAVTGILPNMSEAEIQAELNRVVDEGMLNISIAADILFADGTSEGKANISNTEANRYDVKVALTLDESGETVYESKGIQPGQYIQYIKLVRDLDAGEYPATATFTAYTRDTRQIVGRAAVKIVLHVLS